MKRILVAYDGGEPAHRALDMAADLATHYEATVGVVSVVPFHGAARRSTHGTTARSIPPN